MAQEIQRYLHRDISWLSFNYRVLQEAKDKNVPLFERIKFLAIYSSNLDEFFRVRVANHSNLVRLGKKTKKELDYDPKELLEHINKVVNKQQEEFSDIFENHLIPELKKHGIYLLRRLELNEEQNEFIERYFQDEMMPYVQPVLLKSKKIRPFLNNASLYLTILLHDKEAAHGQEEFAVVKIPSDHLPRFVRLPSAPGRHDLIMLDDIVRQTVSSMFPGYEIIDTYSVKLTRDAELYIDDEFSGDLVQKIRKSLAKRHVGPPSRFVYDREMPAQFMDVLKDVLELSNSGLLPEGRYHNNFDFFGFPDFGKMHLKYQPLPPIPYQPLEDVLDFFRAIRKRDHLIFVPFHSYSSVVRFFEEASRDPKVTHIKIVQYRVAKKSRIMQAMMNAVKMGKDVSCFVEVKARFDEEANLRWGEKLERAGVRVNYSFPGLKVHSKLAMVTRNEEDGPRNYIYMATGNFHEDTAKIYSDFGLFTVHKGMTSEAARVFQFLETVKVPDEDFKHLLVGQFNLRTTLVELIDQEIANAKAGKKARIILKMNSLQDQLMIDKLYEASNAGVKIKLIVRGIFCLIPGIKGMSENIEAISIVDRFLEHARVFMFYNDGDEKIYLSSADWMVRNLSHRIETAFPIYDEKLIRTIKEFVQLQLDDNVKARILDGDYKNEYQKTDADVAIQSQLETYKYIKQVEDNR